MSHPNHQKLKSPYLQLDRLQIATGTMQSLISGTADCSVSANPLNGMLKRENIDRSLLRASRAMFTAVHTLTS
jgi:hypothetical protein